jgi:hypothetical protein
MNTPALICLALSFIGLGAAAEKHGRPRTGNHSFFVALIANGIWLGLLHWGGFFGQAAHG